MFVFYVHFVLFYYFMYYPQHTPDRKHQCKLAEENESCRTDWARDEFCHISIYYHTAPHSSTKCHAHSPCEAD